MKRLSKIYRKGFGLVLFDDDVEDRVNEFDGNDSIEYKTMNMGNGDILEFEEEMISSKNKKQKKRYLNPNAKAFAHKFLKMMK